MKINQYNNKTGERTGYWELYWSAGNLMYKGTYNNGTKIGLWYFYNIDTEKTYKQVYFI